MVGAHLGLDRGPLDSQPIALSMQLHGQKVFGQKNLCLLTSNILFHCGLEDSNQNHLASSDVYTLNFSCQKIFCPCSCVCSVFGYEPKGPLCNPRRASTMKKNLSVRIFKHGFLNPWVPSLNIVFHRPGLFIQIHGGVICKKLQNF